MKKLKLNLLNLEGAEVLTRQQLKMVMMGMASYFVIIPKRMIVLKFFVYTSVSPVSILYALINIAPRFL